MFLAIDRVSKFVSLAFHPAAEMATGGAFMRNVIKASAYQIRLVLTDNAAAFTQNASTRCDGMRHVFDRAGDEHGIQHRLTKPCHPCPNGQAERMNQTVKEATIKLFHCETTQALCAHVLTFVAACNSAKHANGAHPSKPSVKPGTPTPLRSNSTRTLLSRDQTSSELPRQPG